MAKRRLRFGVVTTFPPGAGSLNEYAYHLVRALQYKAEVAEILLFVDELPAGKTYSAEIVQDTPLAQTAHNESGVAAPPRSGARQRAPLHFVPSWRFNGLTNWWRIVRAVRRAKADVVLFNMQFATFGDRKVAAALGLLTPFLLRLLGVPTVVLLHNIMETVDLKRQTAAGTAHPLLRHSDHSSDLTRQSRRSHHTQICRDFRRAVRRPKCPIGPARCV
jgi:hypothetical protein